MVNTIVMCGCFRSGTTIAAGMLNHHPAIIMTNELMVFCSQDLSHVADRIRKIDFTTILDDNYRDRNAFVNEVLKDEALCVERFLELIEKHKQPQVRWYGDKSPAYTLNLPVATRMAGRPKVICCIRDPREICECQVRRYHDFASQNRSPHHWMQESIDGCLTGVTWLTYMERWEEFKATTDLDWHELNYSRLSRDIEGEAVKVAEFLDVPPQPMAQVFRRCFEPKQGMWRQAFPMLNERLPESWIEMMKRHGLETAS